MVRIGVLIGLALASGAAMAVDQPSTYPGCATRELSVAWGGSAVVDLSGCQSFGLGVVATAPAHGSATPEGDPATGYAYTHGGATPAGGGSDRFVVLDDNSDRITVRVTIAAPVGELAIATEALPPLRAGAGMRLQLEANGGAAPYRFDVVDGGWSAGLSMDADGGVAGTPTARGPFRTTLRVTDAKGATAERSLAGEVAPATIALVPARAVATQGQPFRQALYGRGGVPPYRFALEPGGQLPPGIVLDEDGVLSGLTAAPAGAYRLSIRVTDASTGPGEHFVAAPFTLRVAPANSSLKP